MKLALVNMEEVLGDPPLNLAYIVSYVRKYGGFDNIVIIDKEKDLFKKIKQEKPDIVGITTMTEDFFKANNLAKRIKDEMDVPTLVGGVHISALPNCLSLSNFDIGVIGEGEQTMLELLKVFEKYGEFKKEDLKKIDGLIFKNNSEVYKTKPREQFKNLDIIPFPARDLLKMKEYYLTPRKTCFDNELGIYSSLLTSRGCPYKCVFCASSAYWRTVRFHSPEYVVAEIKELIEKYKIEAIDIWDDLFIANRDRVRKIVELIEKEDINEKIWFTIQGRTNMMNDETCQLLKRMNVHSMFFGLESGSPKILGYLKKNTVTVEQHKKALELCKKYGFTIIGGFILGSPGETKEDLRMSFDLMMNKNIDFISGGLLVPFPGTEIWEYCKKLGIVSENPNFDFSKLTNFNFFKLNPNNMEVYMNDAMTKEEFIKEYEPMLKKIDDKNRKQYVTKLKLRYVKYLLSPSYLKRLKTHWKFTLRVLTNPHSYIPS